MFKANLRTFTLITNTLSKDQARSRTAGAASRTSPIRATSPTGSSPRSSRRSSPRCARPIRACRTATIALKAKWFGKDRLEHWDRNAPLPKVEQRTIPWTEARDTVLEAYAGFSPRMADDRPRLLRRALDRRAGPSRQGARRLRASDGAVGAPLCAPQLPGQAAGRDDARARARPRRAPGAGGAERGADGADAADARRDRERVRRDADLPPPPRRRPPTRFSARRCSPPRSRT